MPKLTLTHPHQKDRDAVKQILVDAVTAFKNGHGFAGVDADGRATGVTVDITWGLYESEFVIHAFGMHIKGKAKIEPHQIWSELDLPFGALVFKNKIAAAVKKNLDMLLA